MITKRRKSRGSRSSRRSHGDASKRPEGAFGLTAAAIRAVFRRQLGAHHGKRVEAYNASIDTIAGPYSKNSSEAKHKERMALAEILRHAMHTEPGTPQPDKRAEYEERTRHLGKFEGEPAYVPYFYEKEMEGGGDPRDNRTLFHVTAADRDIFPELKGRKTVWLRHREDGFVVED